MAWVFLEQAPRTPPAPPPSLPAIPQALAGDPVLSRIPSCPKAFPPSQPCSDLSKEELFIKLGLVWSFGSEPLSGSRACFILAVSK